VSLLLIFTLELKGILANFSADLNAVLAGVPQLALSSIAQYEIDLTDQKLTMRTAQAREIPRWMPSTAPQEVPVLRPGTNSTSQANLNSATPSAIALSAVTETPALPSPPSTIPAVGRSDGDRRSVVFALGLMWDSRVDVDLYVRPQPGKDELCFARLVTPQGRYIHDFRDRNTDRDYEWVELWEDVNPSQLEAWINLFEGSGPVHGTISVLYQGRRYSSPFSIPATRGNRGLYNPITGRTSGPHWQRIDLPQILSGQAQ
jgi:hypothetical protein